MPDYLRTHYPNHPSLRSARDSAPKAVDPTRDRATGRYTHSRLAVLCVCGHPLGIHTAAVCDGERPCLEYDCECERYRKSRRSRRYHGREPRRVTQLPAQQAAPDCPACANHWCHVHNPLLPPHDAAPLTLVSDPRELWRVPMDTSCASTVRDERAEREQAEYEREQAERGR